MLAFLPWVQRSKQEAAYGTGETEMSTVPNCRQKEAAFSGPLRGDV